MSMIVHKIYMFCTNNNGQGLKLYLKECEYINEDSNKYRFINAHLIV